MSDQFVSSSASKLSNGRVVVGLSGGVDSSVTAALLKRQGFEVIGVYMKNWSNESPTMGKYRLQEDEYRMDCPWYEEYLDAKRVALQLGIPFELWDFREAYKQKVFDSFIEEFAKGRTPNPDVYCNSLVKFDDFQRRAREELGADFVATGHYARIVEQAGQYYLQIPTDTHKDQTYFLYRLDRDQLAHALFPLAGYTKAEVRQLAAEFGLVTEQKKDSQGLCFIGDVDVRAFVAQWLAPKVGNIVDLAGRVIGQHKGVHLHTIGEKIAVDNAVIARIEPQLKHAIPHYYVADKKVADNVLVAVPGFDHPALYRDSLELESVHWASSEAADEALGDPASLVVRLRHGGALVAIDSLKQVDERVVLTFKEAQRAITPGQHVVLYSADRRVLGGGTISN